MTSGALTALVAGALGAALLAGLKVQPAALVSDPLKLFGVVPEPPPPPPVERPRLRPSERPIKSGKASPANIRSKATEVTAPVPVIAPLVSPPIVVAPQPGIGVQTTQGAAPVPGPGTGAGGYGNGTGSGGYGDGEGDGDGGDFTPPRQRKGRLKMSDNPDPVHIGGRVGVKYAVEPDGRVDDCRITQSSGYPILDQTTCRLIEERFVFKPSLDDDGRPVRAYIVETHEWVIQDDSNRN